MSEACAILACVAFPFSLIMNYLAPESLDLGFVLACSAIVFLMQAGFCLVESGLVRSKNSINVAVKNALDCAISMLLFTCFGFSVMFGPSLWGWAGVPFSVDFLTDPKLQTFLIFQLVFCGATATIISGAVAERIKLRGYLYIVLVVSCCVYPVFGHWAWGGTLQNTSQGWLAKLGFIDWAGSVVVHVVGGFAALAAAWFIGPRKVRGGGGLTGGYSLTLTILGCFLLWFGWWGFNAGSGLAIDELTPLILLNTNLGAVAGGLTAAVYSHFVKQRVEVVYLITGILAGLVSVTGACHALSPPLAILTGAIGALIAIGAEYAVRKCGIDDAVNAFAIHGAAGIWGGVVFGLFGSAELLVAPSRFTQIFVQLLGALMAAGFSFGGVWGALLLYSKFGQLRVTAEEEQLGLNVVEHGATNEVTDLLINMNEHGRTGDYSEDIPFEPHTETGQIALEYNRVLQRVREEIDGHEQTNKWLQSETLRLNSVLQHAGVGIFQLDGEGRFTTANKTLSELFGYSEDELVGKKFDSIVPWHRDNQSMCEQLQSHMKKWLPLREQECQIEFGGQILWTLESMVPILDSDGQLISWLGTVHDITERKQQALAEIEIALAKSEAKGQFLANMSHEIRTPLNGVVGMLDLLASSKLDYRESHYVSIAKASASSLLSVINDILDFSKIEAGHLELEKISFEIRELVESTAEQFAYQAHEKALELNCSIAEDIPHSVVGDPERLRQVLINLMGNAIKFTEQGEINLNISRRGSTIRFSIQDTGIGMSADVKDSLFSSFTQADASTTRKYGGTGLGLSISSKIVGLMGSVINVESETGVGSEFWFDVELPIVIDVQQVGLEAPGIVENLAGLRVLVVDDNATNCEILSGQLKNWGMDVTICRHSPSAIERLLVADRIQKPFELVILDFCMPVMDGRDIAEAMRNQPSLADLPIVLLSSSYELMTAEELELIGIQAAMTKPARQSRLLQTLNAVMAKPSRPFVANSLENEIQASAKVRSDIGQQVTAKSMDSYAMLNQSASENPNKVRGNGSVRYRVRESENAPILEQPVAKTPVEIEPKPTNHVAMGYAADVLIAEDNQVNRLVAERMLTSEGLTVESACDGQIAFEKVCENRYRLVLMDGHMPNMDGLEATQRIRRWEKENSSVPRTPIVAVTANIIQGIKRKCQQAGMDGYLSKPISLESLMAIVEEHIAKDELPECLDQLLSEAEPVADDFADRENLLVREATASTPQLTSPKPVAQPSKSALPSGTPVAQGGLIVTEKLNEQCGGDLDFAVQILQIMKDSLPSQVQNLQSALTAKDLPEVWGIAHQLKGAAGDSCLAAIYDVSAEIEREAKLGKTKEVHGLFGLLEERTEQTLSAISDYIEQLG